MKLKRWMPVVAGTVILLFAGLVYAWSTLSVPIAQEFTDWLEAQRALTFTLLIVFFCLVVWSMAWLQKRSSLIGACSPLWRCFCWDFWPVPESGRR